jgi:hypothetical protein
MAPLMPSRKSRAEGAWQLTNQSLDDQTVLALYAPLLSRLRELPPVRPELSGLVDDAIRVWSRPGFETFLSLGSLRFEPFDYHLASAARHVHSHADLACELRKQARIGYTPRVSRPSGFCRSAKCAVRALTGCLPLSDGYVSAHITLGRRPCRSAE